MKRTFRLGIGPLARIRVAMAETRLLLLSNSRNPGQDYLEHALSLMQDFLGPHITRLLFIPYAAVARPFDEYEKIVRDRFSRVGFELASIHHQPNAKQAVETAQAIVIGGGNTFHLLDRLYVEDLIDTIRDRALAGMPYIGWSAGSNVLACVRRRLLSLSMKVSPS